ncbi:unnamed protein product [Scytosiphon promiscuus]
MIRLETWWVTVGVATTYDWSFQVVSAVESFLYYFDYGQWGSDPYGTTLQGGAGAAVIATVTAGDAAGNTDSCSFAMILWPRGNDDADFIEAGSKTTVGVTASAYDDRPGESAGDVGCGVSGCLPDLAHDGLGEEDTESRWSCAKEIVPDGGQCEITFTFDSPQDITDVQVAFWKGEERTRTLKVKINGDTFGEYESYPGSTFNSFGIQEDDVHTVTMESIGIDKDDWISLLEVPKDIDGFLSGLVMMFASADIIFLERFASYRALENDINLS